MVASFHPLLYDRINKNLIATEISRVVAIVDDNDTNIPLLIPQICMCNRLLPTDLDKLELLLILGDFFIFLWLS